MLALISLARVLDTIEIYETAFVSLLACTRFPSVVSWIRDPCTTGIAGTLGIGAPLDDALDLKYLRGGGSSTELPPAERLEVLPTCTSHGDAIMMGKLC